ncbi:MAG: hypothetical protein CMH48_07950 [Muricauda sp.]|nr:TonB-dependent receptor plug domain-containing protein [Allomuricauda sp.]MAU27028.1 hypothetical protein [Allomuricauda sp.]MBC30764.1 hypothetical protein [Allomuricauda sp.]|tara:strand:+ start:31826 stop:34174 length:2349 start_codon:yes stop_codon:yes gene_type:complete
MKKVHLYTPIFLLIFLFNGLLYAQNSGPAFAEQNLVPNHKLAFDLQQNALDSLLMWQEQVVLHTDKTIAQPKDHLFFKAYILTGPQQVRVSPNNVLKVELLDAEGNLVRSQYHKIDDGTSEGSFEIPKKVKPGDYYFRAYTRWMLNYGPEHFTTKKIRIGEIEKTETFDNASKRVNFFPEGGQLVAGLTNRLAMASGNNTPVNGQIIDEQGNVVSSVKDYGIGIGSSIFVPRQGKRYFLRFFDGSKLPLPTVEDIGCSIQVNNLNEEYAQTRIEVSKELLNEDLYLKGQSRGVTYFTKKIDFDEKGVAEVDIPKEDTPSGLLHLTLVDSFDQVWAERPLYIERNKLQIKVEPVEGATTEKGLKIKVTDNKGNPVKTELSLSLKAAPNGEMDDLKIFDSNIRNQRFINDLMVLAGQFSEVPLHAGKKELPDEIRYTFQNGLEFYGQAYDLNNSLLPNTKIQILISTEKEVLAKEVTTNSEGLFKLAGLQLDGEANMVFRTKGEDTKTKLVKVIPYEYEVPPMVTSTIEQQASLKKSKSRQFIPKKTAVAFKSDSGGDKIIALDEVTLVAKKELRKTSPSMYNIEPRHVVHQDPKRPKTIPELFLGVPGIQVVGLGGINPRLSLPRSAGVGPILWVLDGLPLVQSTNLVEIMNLVPQLDVERIEILYGPQAAIYGTRAAGGAILIYTRTGAETAEYIARKEALLNYEGFHKSIAFSEYSDTVSKKRKDNDLPKTLYWNPSLETDENGEVLVQFSLPDGYTSAAVELKTITQDGKQGYTKKALLP